MHTKKQPQMLPPRMQRRRPPACFRNKTVLTKKFMPYYRQKSTHCQMEEMGIDKIPVLPV